MKIKILDQKNNTVWKKTLNEVEYNYLKKFHVPIKPDLPNWSVFFIPRRTDSIKHAAMDCVSPIILNLLYYQGWPSQLPCSSQLEIIPAFFIELLTFPVRLVTIIPRAIYNAMQPEHPLRAWLYAEENVPEEYTRAESIRITLQGDIKGKERCTDINFSEDRNCRIDTMETFFYKNEHSFNVNFSQPHLFFRPMKDSARKYTGETEIKEVIIPFTNP